MFFQVCKKFPLCRGNHENFLVFVPVALNYDRVLEDRSLIAATPSGSSIWAMTTVSSVIFRTSAIGLLANPAQRVEPAKPRPP